MSFDRAITLGNRALDLRTADERQIQAIAQACDVEDGIARILAQRGFTQESASAFFTPSLREHLPEPLHYVDMGKAVSRAADAITRGEKIAGFTDYDVDGATSLAIVRNYLRWIGIPLRRYVPDRFAEGYGPNEQAMRQLREEGHSLCLMFDCGTAAIDRVSEDGSVKPGPITIAGQIGLDVLVFDHHTPEALLPPAYALVNPRRLDETTIHTQPSACGVSLMFVIALNRELRQRGFLRDRNSADDGRPKEPYVLKLFELAMLGTQQDMMPLTGINRLIVATGLRLANQPELEDSQIAALGYTREEYLRFENPGLEALRSVCGLSREELARKGRELSWQDLSFQLGPRLNAAGRIDIAHTSADLLSLTDAVEALEFARSIDMTNRGRQTIEAGIMEDAMPQADAQQEAGHPVLIVSGESWHPGVVGIVASRIKEKHGLPSIVIGCHEGSWKGSGRSIRCGDLKVDLGGAITAARHAGLLEAGGGHPMAGGLSMDIAKLEAFRQFMHQRLGPEVTRLPKVQPLPIDALMTPAGITVDFITQLGRFAPYGEANPEVMILLPDVMIDFATPTADGQHIRCTFSKQGHKISAIAFRAGGQPLGNALMERGILHIVGTADLNYYNGRVTPQLKVIDALRP